MKAILAFAGAVVAYAAWYRVEVGPWCQAMWFGTAPPIIMGIAFVACYRLLGILESFGGRDGNADHRSMEE